MSLVEATVVLAVALMLAALLAPAIGGFVSDAQHTAAKKDVETIGAALGRMLADTGESWFLIDGNGAQPTSPPSHAAANRVNLLVSDGLTPAVTIARSSAGTDWDDAVSANGVVQRLAAHLVENTPGYRTAASMSVGGEFDPDSGATFNAEHGWRGSYLGGPLGPDPWGQRYAVNVEFLARAPGAGPSGQVNDVVVVSPGPDGGVATRFDSDGAAAGGDDVLYIVSGGSR